MQKRTVIILIVAAALLLLGCCCATAAFLLLRGGGDKAAYTLSDDQKAVVGELGPPQTFTVIFGEDSTEDRDSAGKLPTHRIEYWDYWDAGSRLAFRDGRLVDSKELAAPARAGASYPSLRPEDFVIGMTPQQVAEAIGAAPDNGYDALKGSGADMIVLTFGSDQVKATFSQGRLAAIVTAPVLPAE